MIGSILTIEKQKSRQTVDAPRPSCTIT